MSIGATGLGWLALDFGILHQYFTGGHVVAGRILSIPTNISRLGCRGRPLAANLSRDKLIVVVPKVRAGAPLGRSISRCNPAVGQRPADTADTAPADRHGRHAATADPDARAAPAASARAQLRRLGSGGGATGLHHPCASLCLAHVPAIGPMASHSSRNSESSSISFASISAVVNPRSRARARVCFNRSCAKRLIASICARIRRGSSLDICGLSDCAGASAWGDCSAINASSRTRPKSGCHPPVLMTTSCTTATGVPANVAGVNFQ